MSLRLSGQAAVKSKSICLHLVNQRTNLPNSGVVQLFVSPHPQKVVQLPYWSKYRPWLRNSPTDERLVSSTYTPIVALL